MHNHFCKILLAAFLTSVIAAPAASAATKPLAGHCPVEGLVPLKKYLLPSEMRCFSTVKAAESHGYSYFSETPPPSFRRSEACNYIGIKASLKFYSREDEKCFRSRTGAEQHGYVHFSVPNVTTTTGVGMTYTPPPTALPTTTPTPGPTPTPQSGSPINYPNILLWRSDTNTQVGTCSAVLSGDRASVTMSCTYDYPNVTEFHLHLPPDNTEYCPAPNPLSPVGPYSCLIPPDIAQGIVDGKVFVMIHAGPPGEGEMITAAGYF
jgi:hypothetical protein